MQTFDTNDGAGDTFIYVAYDEKSHQGDFKTYGILQSVKRPSIQLQWTAVLIIVYMLK